MPSRARACLATAILVLTPAVAAKPAEAAGVAPLTCEQLAVSPTFDTDGTAFCAGIRRDETTGTALALTVFVSTDRGTTWRAAAAAGVPVTAGEVVRDLIVSPRYRDDHVVVLHLAMTGLFRSTDAGATFTSLYPARSGRYTPFVGVPAGAAIDAAARTLLVGPAPATVAAGGAVVIDPASGALYPVAGAAPLAAYRYVVSPTFQADGGAFAVATTAAGTDEHVEVYRCTTAFVCAEKAAAFPARYRFDQAWIAPDYKASHTVYVSLLKPDQRAQLYWSRDAGKTFKPWSAAQAVLNPAYVPKYLGVEFAVAPSTPGSHTLWLRGTFSFAASDPPVAQLLRSDDAGVHWRLAAYGRATYQKGSRGTMPVTGIYGPPAAGGETPTGFLVAGGRTTLLMLGRCTKFGSSGLGPFVSRDLGRTWRSFCPK
jgi:hypothetical protein